MNAEDICNNFKMISRMNADYIQVCLLLAALSLKEISKKYLWPKKISARVWKNNYNLYRK